MGDGGLRTSQDPASGPCDLASSYSAAAADGGLSLRDPIVHAAAAAARGFTCFGAAIIAARTPATIWRSSFPAAISARIEAKTLPAASTVHGGRGASCAG